jgi:phosphoglycolate phosphatase
MDRPPAVPPPPPPRLVMFDFDGTVVDSLETYTAALLEACRHYGVAAISTPRDVLALFAGNLFEGMRQAGLDDEKIAAVNRRSAGSYLKALARLQAFPHMTELLTRLAATCYIVIVTSNSANAVSSCLRRLGARGVAEVLGSEQGFGKVAKITGLMARFPDRAPYWFVGDTTGDMREARLAGAEPLGVAWGWHTPEALRAAGAARIAATPAEIAAVIVPDEPTAPQPTTVER